MSMQTTMATISSTFEVGVNMKRQATGGADKMYINLWIAAGRCGGGVRRVRGLAWRQSPNGLEHELSHARLVELGLHRIRARLGTYCRICCNWLGEWSFRWEELGLRDSPRESVPNCQASGGDVIAEVSDEYLGR